MERDDHRVQLVISGANHSVLLPESYIISKMNLRETNCEDGTRMELAQGRIQSRALVLLGSVSWFCYQRGSLLVKCILLLEETGSKDNTSIQLAKDRVQWRTLLLAVLNLLVLLPEGGLVG
jgi:hypothetical protein